MSEAYCLSNRASSNDGIAVAVGGGGGPGLEPRRTVEVATG